MSKKTLRIAARIVFGILALASLVVCIYYIVKGNLSEVLSSMTLCLLSISLGYIYGRNEPEPEEGIVPADEKASVKSHIGVDSIVLDEGEWSLEGTGDGEKISGAVTINSSNITLKAGNRRLVISDITPDSFSLRETTDGITSLELKANKK